MKNRDNRSRDNKHLYLFLFLLISLSSCGYRFGQGKPLLSSRTISVPYVLGDPDGDMTAALIKQLSSGSDMIYTSSYADYILKVKLINLYDENIGYRYDRNKEGRRIDVIIPSELRRTVVAEISVMSTTTGCDVVGPVKITANIDGDHDFNDIDGKNTFSIGQLTNEFAAKEALRRALNRVLAQKIVDYFNNTW